MFIKSLGPFLRQNWRRIAIGTPAVLGGTAVMIFACLVRFGPPDALAATYLVEARSRLEARDHESASICFERLVQSKWGGPEARYGLGLTLLALGKTGRAVVVLNELAPTDQVGYPPAQLWRAKRLLAEARSSPKGLATAERLLGFVLQSAPENIEANALLGELYFKTRRTAQADPHLQRAASDHPELLFLLAKIYDEQGRQSEARRQAELARSIFRKKAETNPDDREARGYWAAAMLVLEDFPAAVDILQQGLARGDDPFYHQALARVYVAQSDALGRDSEASLGDRLALLEEALTHNPSDPNLLDRLVTIIRMGGEEADRVVSRLRGLLAAGKATALVHFALGIAAWERGETEQSRLHFEQASRDAPQMALVANNLAWVLANTEPHDLPRALELANRAIGRWPDQPKCRGTRGHILVKMRKWKDALPDLEAALRARPDDLDLHRLLAETYENLGVTEMASEHRRRTVARDGAESGR